MGPVPASAAVCCACSSGDRVVGSGQYLLSRKPEKMKPNRFEKNEFRWAKPRKVPSLPLGACSEANSSHLGLRKHSARPWMAMPMIIIRVIGCSMTPKMSTFPSNSEDMAMARAEKGIRIMATRIEFSGFHARTNWVTTTTSSTTTSGLMLAYHSGL